MSTGADFARHRPHAPDARVDEDFVRILFVGEASAYTEEIHQVIGNARRGCFEVVRESELDHAAKRLGSDDFDLLLFDLSIAKVDRAATIDVATELAQRVPVVVLTGTEDLARGDIPEGCSLRGCIESADVPGKLRAAIRRARRFGTGVTSPIFCRIESLVAATSIR